MAKLDLLVMPSAVSPPLDTPFQALTDANIRLRQTVRAVTRWERMSRRHGFQILVVDNTGFADKITSSLPSRVRNNPLVRVVDVEPASVEDTARGKGASETKTLIKALELAELPDQAIVAKVNARYFTTNGCFLVEQLSEDFDFSAWLRPKLDSVDTTFYVARAGYLKMLLPKIYIATDDLKEIFVENLYASNTLKDSQCTFERLNYCPAIKGQSGTTGSVASPFNEFRLVSILVRTREALRKKLPFLKPKYQRGR